MLLFRSQVTTYGSEGLVQIKTLWSDVFNTDFPISFYGGNMEDIVEITVDDKSDFIVIHFPCTSSDVFSLTLKESQLMGLYRELRSKYPHRSIFAINMKTLTEITQGDFNMYTCPSNGEHIGFVFRTEFENGGFPNIYIIARPTAMSPYKDLLSVLGYSSHAIRQSYKQTRFGKEFAYVLVNSTLQGRLVKECPVMDTIKFPENSELAIPNFYNTQALDEFAIECGVDKLKVTEGGTVQESIDLADNYNAMEVTYHTEARKRIWRSLIDKKSIYLSDLLVLGAKQSISEIPAEMRADKIPVEMDVANIAKKMCIMEGFIYAIPLHKDFDWESVIGDDGYFIECTDNSFPNSLTTKGDQL